MKLKELYEQKEISVTSLLGKQPSVFLDDLDVSGYNLTSLTGSPESIDGAFNCCDNLLINLYGGPKKVRGDFFCSYNNIATLEGIPEQIEGIFELFSNKLTNLKDIHRHIKFIGKFANFDKNPIKSHVVGLLLIDGLEKISMSNKEVQTILNKYLQSNKDVFACIDELEEAGFSQFAKI